MEGGRFFYAAPTYGQAKRIAWKDLKDMTAPHWSGSPSESELVIRLKTGSEIWLIGMDNPARIEGSQWHGGIMDEYADMKEEAWPEHVQPVTADTNAWVDFIGVPEGRNHYYELAQQYIAEPELFAHWSWPTADVHPEAAARARKILDPRTYRQEYEGSFESSSTTAYYTYSDASLTEQGYAPDAESWLAWDFNAGAKPMATVLIQRFGDMHVAVRDWVTPFTNTEAQCQAIADWLRVNGFTGTLEITGDYAGKRRESSASFSDYEIIDSHFKNHRGYKVRTRPTLAVKDRVASVNALLHSADGSRRLMINRACESLVNDLRKVQWKDNGVQLDDTNDALTHVSDALSYWAYNYYPIDRKPIIVNMN